MHQELGSNDYVFPIGPATAAHHLHGSLHTEHQMRLRSFTYICIMTVGLFMWAMLYGAHLGVGIAIVSLEVLRASLLMPKRGRNAGGVIAYIIACPMLWTFVTIHSLVRSGPNTPLWIVLSVIAGTIVPGAMAMWTIYDHMIWSVMAEHH